MARAEFRLRMPGAYVVSILFGCYALLAMVGGILIIAPFIVLTGLVFAVLGAASAASAATVSRRTREAARALYVPGAEFSAEYGPVLTLRSPGRESHIPYPAMSALRRRKGAVLVAIATQPSYVMPEELCPPEAFQAISAARHAPVPVPDTAGFAGSVEPGGGFISAVSRRILQRVFLEPGLWFAVIALIVMAVGMPIVGGWPWWLGPIFALGLVVVLGGLLALLLPLLVRRVVQSLRGGRIFASFDAEGFAVLDRGVSTRRRYDTVRQFTVLGEAVELVSTASVDPELLPTALFPAGVIERLAGAPDTRRA